MTCLVNIHVDGLASRGARLYANKQVIIGFGHPVYTIAEFVAPPCKITSDEALETAANV